MMSMPKKSSRQILDSRHLKVIAAKKDELKDCLVFIWLDENKYGQLDKAQLKNLVVAVDQIEPDAVYFPMTNKMRLEIYDKSELKNRNLVITVKHEEPDTADFDEVEEEVRRAIPEAKSIKFIHQDAYIEEIK